MSGTLYLCATPIGNLGDMTLRVIEILKTVDIIAAEDTRNTIKLLNHFEIKTPMTSYHQHNLDTKGSVLIEKLKEGKNIALVSDAGMPGISDPGEDMAKRCRLEGIPVTIAPGASAGISALVLSGMDARRYFSATGYSMDLKRYGTRNWGWYMVFGILAILCSIGVIWQPALGAFTLVYMIAYALLIIGIFRVMLSFELKSLHKRNKEAQAE